MNLSYDAPDMYDIMARCNKIIGDDGSRKPTPSDHCAVGAGRPFSRKKFELLGLNLNDVAVASLHHADATTYTTFKQYHHDEDKATTKGHVPRNGQRA